MNKFCRRFALLALLPGCFTLALVAQPATNATRRPQPDRWLLIVDTSAAMERRAKAVEGVVGELLASGMNGQMHTNDEIGIWTFNKELYAGVAPMQSWQPAKSNLIASRSVAFLNRQVYRDKGRLKTVLEELPRVVAESRSLTVLLLSDGSAPMAGTPFDEAMNSAYAQHKPALAQTRMPLVTVLRSHRGKYIGQSVSFAPWPVEFPPFPEAEKKPEIAPTNSLAAKPAATAKPIYIKSEPKKVDPAMATAVGLPVAPVPPLPIKATEPAPIVAPIEPPPVTKPAEPVPPTPNPPLSPKPVEGVPAAPQTPTPSVAPTAPPAVASRSPAPIAASVATAAGDMTARKWPLILGIAFMWAAIVAALVLARRARRAKAASFITRSFDQNDK